MASWDEYAAHWDDSAAVRAYANGAFESLASLAEAIGFDLTGATTCDFGCGTGLLTERLASRCAHIDAVDTSSAMLEELGSKIDRQRWDHVRLLEWLPATPQRYDLIVCSSVLSFVKDYPALVKTLVTHLGAGGLFVQWDWELDPEDDESHGLTSTAIHQTLQEAGLETVAVGIGFEATADGDTMRPLMGSGRRAS